MVPCTKDLSESDKNICGKVGIQVCFKQGNTIKSLPIAPKISDIITQKCLVRYGYKCDRLECDDNYMGESARTFGNWLKEHLRALSPFFDHANTSAHYTKLDNFSIVGMKSHSIARTIKQAMFISVNDPPLNKNIVIGQLYHIWGEVLFNTPDYHPK